MFKIKNFRNFYMLIFILWYSTEIIFNTTLKTIMGIPIGVISNVINWLIFAMLMIQIVLFQVYNKRELIIIIGITLPIIVATVLSDNKALLSAWMFIVAAKNSDLDEIVYVAYRILLIMIPIIFALCILGFIGDNTVIRNHMPRYSLGFLHPNQLGLRIFQLTVCHCYINRNRLSKINYLWIFIAIIFTIKVPKSQTAYTCLSILFILFLVYDYAKNQEPIIMEVYTRSLLIGAFGFNICSIILSYLDLNMNKYLILFDRWMSERFSYSHKAWLIYGLSYFGQRVYIKDEESAAVAGITSILYLDNAYVSILLRFGIIVFFIFSFCYLYLIKKMTLQKKYVLVTILFLYSLYGIMENGLYMITHNIFLIAFSRLLYNRHEEHEK